MSDADDGMSKVTSLADRGFKESGKGRRRGGDEPFYEGMSLNNSGGFRADLHNTIAILRHHPAWKDVFALDEFSNKIIKTRSSPLGDAAREFDENDATLLAAWSADPDGLNMNLSKTMAHDGITAVARENGIHPVREYLNSLHWDRRRRIPHMFSDHFGAEHNPYTQRCAINFMISAVARIYEPGCQVDFMLIFEGKQGIRKSSAMRALFSTPWFTEAMESPYNKDFYLTLLGHWCIEIAEMQAFSKAEANKVKQSVSNRVDSYRPPYGRHVRAFPRQSVFVGTTNDDSYLRDPTGARRFLPIRCKDIDVDAIEAERDQLWAEAVTRYRRGQPWWKLPAQAEAEQDMRYQSDSWEEPIVKWLEGHAAASAYPPDFEGRINAATTTELMANALGIEVGKHGRQDQMRVGAIMKRLGWQRGRLMTDGARTYVYRRPSEAGKAGEAELSE